MPLLVRLAVALTALISFAGAPCGQAGSTTASQKISDSTGGLTTFLNPADVFGNSCAGIGDQDGDGIPDLAVGSRWSDDGGLNRGAVYVLLLNSGGSVASQTKISSTSGGFGGELDNTDRFGESVASLGDLDGDGHRDLAVGAIFDDDGGLDRGAVWILFLDGQGRVTNESKISSTAGDFGTGLATSDHFGSAVANLGDLNGDGRIELAVGAEGDDDGGSGRGAIWILSLNSDGTVQSKSKISSSQGGFGGVLADGDGLGWSLSALADLDGDGVTDLAAGTPGRDVPGSGAGSVWTLLLSPDGSVKSQTEIGFGMGNFGGSVGVNDIFGASVAGLGDIDGDGTGDLAIGASGDDAAGTDKGVCWIVFLDAAGRVKSELRLTEGFGGFGGDLDNSDLFGFSVARLGDVDRDGVTEIAVGAPFDDDGGTSPGSNYGAAWVLFLEGVPQGTVNVYGCGGNPEGSMSVVEGTSRVGSTLTLGLDDPAGNFPGGALPFLVLALAPDVNFPCGSAFPGFGLDPQSDGELLISLAAPTPIGPILTGAPWLAPGVPSAVEVVIPNEPNLIGLELFSQGVLFDPNSLAIGLTDAAQLILGL